MRNKPIVLFAAQAPTLLNRLVTSPAWDLRAEPMGDHDGIAEMRELGVPSLAGDTPDVIVVCSPRQLKAARGIAIAAAEPIPIVWAAHNGYEPSLTDGWEGPVLTFSANNLATHTPRSRQHTYVIRPSFQPKPDSRTTPAYRTLRSLFTMESRPETRVFAKSMRAALRGQIVDTSSVPVVTYGQHQPAGYLEAPARERLFRGGSLGYLSCLPTNAGFALAEHEALEAGCPLLALAWGDAHVTLAGYPGLCHSEAQMVRRLEELASVVREGDAAIDARRAQYAEAGWDALLTHTTPRIQNDGINAFLDGLLYA
jgi:hypothetical protein